VNNNIKLLWVKGSVVGWILGIAVFELAWNILPYRFIVVAFLPEGEKHPMDIKVERIFEIADSAVVPEVGYDYEGPGREEWFDPNSYFRVLEHLSIRSGYTIDYVYRAYPVYFVPYIKPLKTRPLNSIAEVMAFMKMKTHYSAILTRRYSGLTLQRNGLVM